MHRVKNKRALQRGCGLTWALEYGKDSERQAEEVNPGKSRL